jgi:hypothetical protein
MVEVILVNATAIRAMNEDARGLMFETIDKQWCSFEMHDNHGNRMNPAGYWGILSYKNNRPTVYRKMLSGSHGTVNGRKFIEELHVAFMRMWRGILTDEITGHVVLYRTNRGRWADIKYPLHIGKNTLGNLENTFFIMTGNIAWTERLGNIYDGTDESLIPEFIRFRSNISHRRGPALKYASQRSRMHTELQRRAAAIFQMLRVPSSEWSDRFEALTYNESMRCGFLMWINGEVKVWWHIAQNISTPQHIVPANIPTTLPDDFDVGPYTTLDLNTNED